MDASVHDRWLAHAERETAASGLRFGTARRAPVELLAQRAQCLVSAQELAQLLAARGAGSHASTYRLLDELHELGLVHHHGGADGIARYEIADPAGRHHHLVDDHTEEVRPFADEQLLRALRAAADRLDVELTDHHVVLRGRLR